jgi:hypothetical protein
MIPLKEEAETLIVDWAGESEKDGGCSEPVIK